MKTLIAALFLFSFSSFANETIIPPSITTCDEELLSYYEVSNDQKSVTLPKQINIEARILGGEADPAIWSVMHATKVEFPLSRTKKKACFLIEKALVDIKSVKSIGYSASRGRLIRMSALVASDIKDGYGSIGEKEIELKIRVNQKDGTVTFE